MVIIKHSTAENAQYSAENDTFLSVPEMNIALIPVSGWIYVVVIRNSKRDATLKLTEASKSDVSPAGLEATSDKALPRRRAKTIPATVLTGFLGAGKTTLLNHLLTRSSERVAVIVNEYGEVGIDGKLIVETQDDVIELNNGCICCTVRGDLIGAVRDLIGSGRPVDRLIIETSGLADPAPVIQSFILDEVMSERVHLDAIVTVVDARNFDFHKIQDEGAEQIAFADVLLLNKTDLESEERVLEIEREIRLTNPLARILRTRGCAVEPAAVLDVAAFDLKAILALDPHILDEHEHEHDPQVGAEAFTLSGPLDAAAFNRWITTLTIEKGADLFRSKGVLDITGQARRLVFHSVHMTLEGHPGTPWKPGEPRRSEIVFIGRGLDRDELARGLRSCVACPSMLAS